MAEMAHARAAYLGLETEIISMAEAKKMHPLRRKGIVRRHDRCRRWQLDPKARRMPMRVGPHQWAGSTRTPSEELQAPPRRNLDSHQQGHTSTPTRRQLRRVWAREVGRMVGLELPCGHEHSISSPTRCRRFVAYNRARPRASHSSLKVEIYMRQERPACAAGTYERDWCRGARENTPWAFGRERLAATTRRIAPNPRARYKHFPARRTRASERVINGPFIHARRQTRCRPVQGADIGLALRRMAASARAAWALRCRSGW